MTAEPGGQELPAEPGRQTMLVLPGGGFPRTLVEYIVLAGVYYGTARLSLHLAIPHTGDTPVWPPSGIAVAALVWRGRRLAPALLVSAFLVNVTIGTAAPVCVGIAIGNTAEYFAASYLLERAGFRPELGRIRDAVGFILLGAIASPVVAATLGPGSLWMGGVVPAHQLPVLWLTWWVGDGVGVLVFTPLILVVIEALRDRKSVVRRPAELVVALAGFVAVLAVVFGFGLRLTYLAFAFVPLFAVRYGTLGSVGAALSVWSVAVTASLNGAAPFGQGSVNTRFLLLESYITSFAAMGYVLAASSNQRLRFQQQVIADRTTLEAQVELIDHLGRQAARERAAAQAEHDRVQSQIHQTLRLRSLGQLAGGIAHDFNNLLAVIITYSAVAERKLAGMETSPEGVLGNVKEIRAAANRATRLASKLLTFARTETSRLEELDVNQVVRQLTELLRTTLGGRIDLATALSNETPRVAMDTGQLEQILVNLAINARDALPRGGRVTISTGRGEVPSPLGASWVGLAPGRYARITVSDNGLGMSPEVRARVMEPFFTTKAPGEGTGLGLSTVHGIVTAAKGAVTIESEVDRGTSVVILIPAVDTSMDTTVATGGGAATDRTVRAERDRLSGDEQGGVAAGMRGTHGRAGLAPPSGDPVRAPLPEDAVIDARQPRESVVAWSASGADSDLRARPMTALLVDDDRAVLEATRQVLFDAGFSVLVASEAGKALDIASAYPRSIDILITDVVMPQMSGWELARAVVGIRPATRVLFVSAYVGVGEDGEAGEAALAEGASIPPSIGRSPVITGKPPASPAFLSKPFAPEELVTTLRAVLSS